MEYAEKKQHQGHFKPRLIIHGGAGNILRDKVSPEKYQAYKNALLNIVSGLILGEDSRTLTAIQAIQHSRVHGVLSLFDRGEVSHIAEN